MLQLYAALGYVIETMEMKRRGIYPIRFINPKFANVSFKKGELLK